MDPRRGISRLALPVLLSAALPALAAPPLPPVITEPAGGEQAVSHADVHMVTAAFSDPDGIEHLCSDWELWSVSPRERVWAAACVTGLEKTHLHLADGVFEGALAGARELLPDTAYRLQVRFRDALDEWSEWSERIFRTGAAGRVFALELQDVAESPPPRWTDSSLNPVILPPGADPPFLRIESAAGELLLELRGLDGARNRIINPGPLAGHGAARARFGAGAIGANLVLPETDLVIADGGGAERPIYLPAVNLPPGQETIYWISASSGSYHGDASQSAPDFSKLARGAAVPWLVQQSGFRVEVAASGFRMPVNIAFVPRPGDRPDSPLYYVTELYGDIKVITRDGTVRDYAAGLLDYTPECKFPGSGEQGLAGIAVEPESGDVLASLLYAAPPGSATRHAKVVRFLSADGGLTGVPQEPPVLDIREPLAPSHQIAGLSIGPDGMLYVHVGDGEFPAKAQDIDSFRGKILRLNLDGSPAADNPFYDLADGVTARDSVYALGFRNPFGGGWRAEDGFLYEVENGPATDRFAKVVSGENYSWDEPKSDELMTVNAIHNWSPAASPVNIVFIQPQTFGGSGFPPEKMGHAFVTESGPTWASGPQFSGKRISEFVLDADGALLESPVPLIEYGGSGKATAVALAAGPDGLYFSDFYKDLDFSTPCDRGARILRIHHTGAAERAAGLKGEYHAGIDLAELRLIRTDAAVDFDWKFGSPDSTIGPERFSARWTGQVEPRFSETYTLFTRSDDGVRLWVDGELLIDNWTDHAAVEDIGIAALTAGRKHDIKMEYYENGGLASVSLLWESPSQAREVIPASRLSSPILQRPFRGAPIPLPGLVEAEDFDLGGEAVAYHDVDPVNHGTRYRSTGVDIEVCEDDGGGFNIGWTAAGEWLEYTVTVAKAGAHRIEARVASEGPAGQFHIEFDGVDATGPMQVPDTGGWQEWTTIAAFEVPLAAGPQVMRIVERDGVGNINWIRVLGRLQRPGDCNQDGFLDISDAVCLLSHLFLGNPELLPCGEGTSRDPANLLLLDSSGDERIDIADAVTALEFLFLDAPAPRLAGGCRDLPGCPVACGGG